MVAAEDADAREAAQQARRPPVRVREERELARACDGRPRHGVVAEAEPARHARRMREHSQERGLVVARSGRDRLDPEGDPRVDLAKRGAHAVRRPRRR